MAVVSERGRFAYGFQRVVMTGIVPDAIFLRKLSGYGLSVQPLSLPVW